MIQTVRPFQRTTDPSFPDNDALPKKGEDEKQFDKRFNTWYDDVKVNLDRLQDQLKTFFQTDINDSISTQGEVTGSAISSLGVNTASQIGTVVSSVTSLSQSVETSVTRLAEDIQTNQQTLVSLGSSLSSTIQDLQDLKANLYSE